MDVMVLCLKKMSFYLKRKLIETRKIVINTYNPYVTSEKTDISIFHLRNVTFSSTDRFLMSLTFCYAI